MPIDKEYLLSVAQVWAEETLDAWFREFDAWDNLFGAEDSNGFITGESLEWIQENVKFTIKVEEK